MRQRSSHHPSLGGLLLLLAIAFLLFTLPAFGAETRGVKQTQLIKESVTGRYLALLIGNNDYRHWPKLKTAVRGCPAPVPR